MCPFHHSTRKITLTILVLIKMLIIHIGVYSGYTRTLVYRKYTLKKTHRRMRNSECRVFHTTCFGVDRSGKKNIRKHHISNFRPTN